MGHDSVFLDSFLRQEPLINHSVYSSPYLDVAMATLQVGTLFCFPGHLALLRSRAKHILSLLSCNPGNSMKQYSVFLAPRPLLGESHLSCHEGLSKARYPQTSVTLKDMWSKISDYLPPFYLQEADNEELYCGQGQEKGLYKSNYILSYLKYVWFRIKDHFMNLPT